MDSYKDKYLKYKNKYLELQRGGQIGGSELSKNIHAYTGLITQLNKEIKETEELIKNQPLVNDKPNMLCSYIDACNKAKIFINNYKIENVSIIDHTILILIILNKNTLTLETWKRIINIFTDSESNKKLLKNILLVPENVDVTSENKYIIFLQYYFMLIMLLYTSDEIIKEFETTIDCIRLLCRELCNTNELKVTYVINNNKQEMSVLSKINTFYHSRNDENRFTTLIAVIGFLEYYKDQ